MVSVLHLVHALTVGGKERAALELARHARARGEDHRLFLFALPFRSVELDLDPGDVPWEHVRAGRGLDLRFVRTLGLYVQRHGFDVVHAYNDSALVYAVLARILVRRSRFRIVSTFHTRPSHPTALGRRLCLWASKRADHVLAVSPDLAHDYLATRWSARAEVVWNGVDTKLYRQAPRAGSWRRRLGIAEDELLIGHVARFHPVKRQMDLVRAFRTLRSRGIAAHLVFVGFGAREDPVWPFLREEERIHWIEHVRDMATFYRELDVFALCSVEEAAPLVLLEAMATGLPCVATDAGSCAFLLGADETSPAGLVTPAAQPERLADALERLLGDASLRRTLSVRARRRVRMHFSREREWREYEERYR